MADNNEEYKAEFGEVGRAEAERRKKLGLDEPEKKPDRFQSKGLSPEAFNAANASHIKDIVQKGPQNNRGGQEIK